MILLVLRPYYLSSWNFRVRVRPIGICVGLWYGLEVGLEFREYMCPVRVAKVRGPVRGAVRGN